MQGVIAQIEAGLKKARVVEVKSGDTVRVHQKVVEGGKTRTQVFEGLVIRVSRRASLSSSFTVRRISSGVGVEKTYLIHSPNVLKIEVTKRSRVRRNYLSYMRRRTGKSARLSGVGFDRQQVNAVADLETGPVEPASPAEVQPEKSQPSSAEPSETETPVAQPEAASQNPVPKKRPVNSSKK